MRHYIDDLPARLEASNPDGLKTVQDHVGDDLSELQEAMRSVLPSGSAPAPPLVWNPHAGDNEIIAHLKDLVQRMATETGRDERLEWKEAAAIATAQAAAGSGKPANRQPENSEENCNGCSVS